MLRLIALLLVSIMLAACSSSQDTTVTPTASAPASASTNALAGTPMAVYGHDLNRAKNVQNLVNKQAKKQAAAIDAATGGH